MALSREQESVFNPYAVAESVHRNVAQLHPEITLEESEQVVLGLAENAKVKLFIAPLAQNTLTNKSLGKGKR